MTRSVIGFMANQDDPKAPVRLQRMDASDKAFVELAIREDGAPDRSIIVEYDATHGYLRVIFECGDKRETALAVHPDRMPVAVEDMRTFLGHQARVRGR